MSRKKPPQFTLEEWQDATWQYLLEHSDITTHGALFVKFHTNDRISFEKRIRARIKGYTRDDSRLNMTVVEKKQHHERLRTEHVEKKKTKREKWKATQEERRAIFKQLEVLRERQATVSKFPKPLQPFINSFLTVYTTARTRVLQWKQRYGKRHRRSAGNNKSPAQSDTA